MFLTLEQFNEIAPDAIIAQGITTNDENGAYMTNMNHGRSLRYVAKKGYTNDWCIYCFWESESTFQSVMEVGDKITGRDNIMRVIPCEEEVYKLYRR